MTTDDQSPPISHADNPAQTGAHTSHRRTKKSVYIWDKGAEIVITIGGVAVLAAVLGICLYLFSETIPLFRKGTVGQTHFVPSSTDATNETHPSEITSDLQPDINPDSKQWVLLDEYQTSALVLSSGGSYRAIELATGATIVTGNITSDLSELNETEATPRLTAMSVDTVTGALAAGYADGTVRIGRIGFDARSMLVQDIASAPVPSHITHAPRRVGQHAALSGAERNETTELQTAVRVIDTMVGVVAVPDSDKAVTLVNFVQPVVQLGEPAPLKEGDGRVALIDFRKGSSKELLATMREDGTGSLVSVRYSRPLGGGQPVAKLRSKPLVLSLPEDRALPQRMKLTSDGEQLLMVWDDSFTQRYARPIDENPNNRTYELVQELSLAHDGASVTSIELLNGGQTLIVGQSTGVVSGWFAARDPSAGHRDGKVFVEAHTYNAATGAITGLAPSRRDRSFAVASDDNTVSLWHMTSGKNIATIKGAQRGSPHAPIASVGMSPKNEGVVTLDAAGDLTVIDIDEGYPEATLTSLFGAVHYEGEPKPGYVYQSSASDNTAETKMNLRPLIHGTLKATVYAMLIAVPLGVLAAIFSSEFLHPRVRNYVKPIVELMASLPSVVLGFLAAFVLAPWVETFLPAVLLGLVIVPIGIYAVSLCWQVVPDHRTRAVPSSAKFGIMTLTLLGTLALAALLGPTVERALFRPDRTDVLTMAGSVEPIDRADWPAWVGARTGVNAQDQRKLQRDGLVFQFGHVSKPIEPDAEYAKDYDEVIEEAGFDQPSVRRWLDGSIASAMPGWQLVMLFPAGILVFLAQSRLLSRPWGNWLSTLAHRKAALAEMVRFAVLLLVTIGIAHVLAMVLTSAGFDPRSSVFGPFTQRNSLVVGLIMGFAVIPIIYTISEDALSSVPNSLRSASLGSGATRWQTAVRVVMPVAASGIFSACMIGLGRAVGETMIVLMATGNTPVMDWNIFGGFRTLAANIAVELPEAPKGGAHYRVLFLCGLVLFLLTFIINTTAEMVRQHVRKKNAGL